MVSVIGHRLEPEHFQLRDFLTRIAQPYEWHEADSEDGRRLLARHGATAEPLPVVIDGETVIADATAAALARAWDVSTTPSRASEDDSRRLDTLGVTLDHCWDLLRQRRALRDAGYDPDAARVRDTEQYQQ
jgi:hypothetical protein